jgi:hypothetical protein
LQTVCKNDDKNTLNTAVEYKIEIVICVDGAINGENVATD